MVETIPPLRVNSSLDRSLDGVSQLERILWSSLTVGHKPGEGECECIPVSSITVGHRTCHRWVRTPNFSAIFQSPQFFMSLLWFVCVKVVVRRSFYSNSFTSLYQCEGKSTLVFLETIPQCVTSPVQFPPFPPCSVLFPPCPFHSSLPVLFCDHFFRN